MNRSRYEDTELNNLDNNEGNHRLDMMRMPRYNNKDSNSDNFKTVRPSGRELSEYSAFNLSTTPGGNFKSMKEINFTHLWNRLLKDEKINKARINYFTSKPILQPVSKISMVRY